MNFNKEVNIFKKYIKKYDKIAFFHHINPDGDALSCSYGFLKALKKKYPNKTLVLVSDLEILKTRFSYIKFEEKLIVNNIDSSFLAIVGDASIEKRIYNFEALMKAGKKIVFDHHQNINDFSVDYFWHAPFLDSSSIQANYIVKKMKIKLDEEIAFLLLIGILSDTSNFIFSLNDLEGPKIFVNLLRYISREKMDQYYKNIFAKTRLELEAQALILNNIEFSQKVVYVKLKKELISKFDMQKDFFNSKVNIIGNVVSYPIWLIATENKEAKNEFIIDVSIRSNGPNVNAVAEQYNGGGHLRASGAKLTNWNQFDELIEKLNKL